MKKLWIVLPYLLLATQVSLASTNAALPRLNPLLKFIASIQGVQKFALYTIISNRCDRYMTELNKYPCYEAVSTEVALLDFDVLLGNDKVSPLLYNPQDSQSYVFIAFKNNFLRLLNSQDTTVFLESINVELNRFLTGEKREVSSIWDVAVRHYRSEELAAMALAALFQDISQARLHLAYLNYSNTRGNAVFENNRELLDRVIGTVNMVLDFSEDNFRTMFYPREVKAKLNRTIYHFYVPLYLALALEKKGIQKKYAFTAPLFLTLSYEFVTAAGDLTYLLRDPESIQNVSKINDMYAGYNGANFGVKTMNVVRNFDDVQRAFNSSTRAGVLLLLNR